MQVKNFVNGLVLAGALGGSLAGCYAEGDAHVVAVGQVQPAAEVEVEVEPPPPRQVVIVQRPGFVFIEGRWARSGGSWVWREGYYERERRGYHWVKGYWSRRGRRHVWIEGHWSR